MPTLYIFGDESGTMPLDDADNPFVAVTVAVLDKLPVLIKGSDNDEKMVQIFKRLNLIPYAAIVNPYPGYSKLLKVKYEKINVMARATRLITGTGATYLDDETLRYGFDLRNTVWVHAMMQAIALAVLDTLFKNSIDAVEIILDRKTMKPSMRLVFKEIILNRIGDGIKQFLKSVLHLNPTIVSEWESRVRFSSKTTVLRWSDESEELEKQFGLRLADRLSRTIYRSQTTRQPGIEVLFKAAGYNDFVHDISELVTRIDERLVDNFKKTTGLPEPREL